MPRITLKQQELKISTDPSCTADQEHGILPG